MSTPNAPGASHASQVDSGSRILTVFGLAGQELTGGDTLEGGVIDRALYGMPLSCQFAWPVTVTIASGESMDFAITVMDATTAAPTDPESSTPGTFAEYGDTNPTIVTLEGNDEGSELETCVILNVDLAGARRFVRADIMASGELSLAGVCVLGGVETLPFP
jgi:hypothetical protein